MVRLTESLVYIRTKCTVESVKKLNLWGCDIDDISLCSEMVCLEILSLSVNKVDTLESLQHCPKLKELYIRKNLLKSLSELEYLRNLKDLRVLWVDDNPCTKGEYRHKVLRILPQLTKLDDKAVTLEDHLEPSGADDSVPECDMHPGSASSSTLPSARSATSARRSSALAQEAMMTRSLYGKTIVDTVMQPTLLHFGDDASDDETTTIRSERQSQQNLMSQSVYGVLPQEPISDDWGDFSIEEDPLRPHSMDAIASRMCMSMHDGYYSDVGRRPQYPMPHQVYDEYAYYPTYPGPYCTPNGLYRGRSVSAAPRRRLVNNHHFRGESHSPARDHRLTKLMSAVSVLLDELDQEGLREVIDEAQKRIKKQR